MHLVYFCNSQCFRMSTSLGSAIKQQYPKKQIPLVYLRRRIPLLARSRDGAGTRGLEGAAMTLFADTFLALFTLPASLLPAPFKVDHYTQINVTIPLSISSSHCLLLRMELYFLVG